MNYRQFLFMQHRCTPDEGYHAINAIRMLSKAGKPIPEELMPWLNDALDAWVETHKRTVGKHVTRTNWNQAVGDVQLLRKRGFTKNRALKAIAERDGVSVKTLGRNYSDKSEYGSVRVMADKMYAFHEQMRAEYPDYQDHFHPLAILSK